MDNIVEELIRIEEMAGQYMSESEKERMDVSARTRAEIHAVKDAIAAETAEKIRHLTENAKISTIAALKDIAGEREAMLQKLDAAFKENREAWEAGIVERILYESR